MEQKIEINLNSTKKIRKFIQTTRKFMSDINVISNKYVINGKSILGLYSLDLSKNILVQIESEDENEILKFNEVMKEFL